MPALISVARATIDTASALLPSSPLPSTITAPLLTSSAARLPFASSCGLPVVSVTFGVLIKPQPLQVMPYGLATITLAALPATSV